MDSTNDRQRKDRLIQTRVPQNLESTLKDEARKRRLSVSHLIRNVLEDTFNLVDNVVSEVDRVVADSVGMAQTLKRDARRLAATARGETYHRRDSVEGVGGVEVDVHDVQPPEEDELDGEVVLAAEPEEPETPSVPSEPPVSAVQPLAEPPRSALAAGALSHVYGFQELVLNRPAQCASCGVDIARGSHAFLGMTDTPGPRVWVCQDCVGSLNG